MTAEEIRSIINQAKRDTQVMGAAGVGAYMLGEIAAQLAEQSELMRQDHAWRREQMEKNEAREELRNDLLRKSANGMQTITDKMTEPPPTPGEVAHLACLIRNPDGEYAFATYDNRFVPIGPDEIKRILPIFMPQETEAKPQ